MRYDRLLQLGGIDRVVPPIPGYITKEELKQEISVINTKIPADASADNQLADKDYVDRGDSYKNVYVGVGDAYSDVMVAGSHIDVLMKGEVVSLTSSDKYLWVIVPSGENPNVLTGGIITPMTQQSDVTVDDVTYKVLKSDETMDGDLKVYML